MEIIRPAPVQHRALNARRIALKAQRLAKHLHIPQDLLLLRRAARKRMRLPAPPLPAHRRHRRLHAVIAARHIHRQIPAHGVAVHAQPLRIHLRLLLQKRQPAPAAVCQKIPVVVFRVLPVLVELLRPRQHRGIARHIQLRGIHRAPVRVRVPGLRALHAVKRRLPVPVATPVHRQRRIPAPHQQLHLAQRRPLPPAMDVHPPRHLPLHALRKAIDRRHPRRLAFEAADQIPHLPVHPALLLPLPDHLRLQRIPARIKIRPQLLHRSRHRLRRPHRSSTQQQQGIQDNKADRFHTTG